MWFQVLGPVGIGPHTPSAAKLRVVLATLLMRANEVVSVESLMDELWGEGPPRTATTTLQVYISQLRKILSVTECAEEVNGAAATESRIITRQPGYLFRVLPDELDLTRFESLAAQGAAAGDRHDFTTAAQLLREALALWKGPALCGVAQGPLLQAAVVHLTERRLTVLDQRITAELELGRHRELCGELMALTHEHPVHEGLHAHLMVALYRSDRQSDALRVFDRVRHRLVEELGTDPGPALQHLYQRILRLDPGLRVEHDPGARGGRPGPVLQPPRPTPAFTGRGDSLAAAESILRDSGAGTSRLLAVVGKAGVGKTAFAVQLAHRTGDVFPDGCVLLNLRCAEGRPLEPAEALLRLLRRLDAGHDAQPAPTLESPSGTAGTPEAEGRPSHRRQPTVEDLSDALRRTLFRRRLLLILDDVVSESQIRPILESTTGPVVMTSSRMLAIPDLHRMTLDVLRPEEAESLLLATGGARVAADRPALARVAELCGYLPLALCVAGAGLASRPHWSSAALAARLDDERVRLSVLAIGDLDVRASLLVGYQEASPATQRAFRLLGLAPAPDFALWSASALLGVPAAEAEQALEQLTHIHLLEARAASGSGARYGFHGLLRVMARELLATEDAASVRAATARLCTTGLTLARHADSLLAPGRARPDTAGEKPAAPGGAPPRETDAHAPYPRDVVRDAPLRWFQEEITGLVAVVRQAHAAELWPLTWQLFDSLTSFFQAGAVWAEWAATSELALDAAREADDAAAQASVLQSQGDLAWQQRRVDQAAACYETAIRQARRIQDRCAAARALIGLADVTLDRGLVERASAMYAHSLVLCRARQDLGGLIDALRGLALTELRRGRRDAALDRFAECRAAAGRLGDRRWSEFARRATERILAEPAEGGASLPVEVRPGVWLIGGSPPEDHRPTPPHPAYDRWTGVGR